MVIVNNESLVYRAPTTSTKTLAYKYTNMLARVGYFAVQLKPSRSDARRHAPPFALLNTPTATAPLPSWD